MLFITIDCTAESPLHRYATLFGVYGMLGIGMILICLHLLVLVMELKTFSFYDVEGGVKSPRENFWNVVTNR